MEILVPFDGVVLPSEKTKAGDLVVVQAANVDLLVLRLAIDRGNSALILCELRPDGPHGMLQPVMFSALADPSDIVRRVAGDFVIETVHGPRHRLSVRGDVPSEPCGLAHFEDGDIGIYVRYRSGPAVLSLKTGAKRDRAEVIGPIWPFKLYLEEHGERLLLFDSRLRDLADLGD